MPITFKIANIKIPQIARWRICGIGDKKIAELINMTPSGLAQLLGTKEYIDYEAALMNGHLSEMDRALAGKISIIRGEFKNAVPAALRCLVDAVTQRRDMRTAFMAAKEILDRDPDRTLASQVSEQQAPESVPVAVLDAVVEAGNKTAQNYNDEAGKKVN
jgi:hypothetical protein